MRTTLTLDDDVAAKLKEAAQETGLSFKEVVNRMLRRGLMEGSGEAGRQVSFKVRPRDLGMRPGTSYDNIGELLEDLDKPYPR